MTVLFSVFWGASVLFSIAIVIIYLLTSGVWRFLSPSCGVIKAEHQQMSINRWGHWWMDVTWFSRRKTLKHAPTLVPRIPTVGLSPRLDDTPWIVFLPPSSHFLISYSPFCHLPYKWLVLKHSLGPISGEINVPGDDCQLGRHFWLLHLEEEPCCWCLVVEVSHATKLPSAWDSPLPWVINRAEAETPHFNICQL
jgi:hypothetical protein